MTDRAPADALAFRAFRLAHRDGYLRFATDRLGSEAEAEAAVERAFEAIRDAWPGMLRMAHLERHAQELLVRYVDAKAPRGGVTRPAATPSPAAAASVPRSSAARAAAPDAP
ncbi:hypothetical protein GCM10020221_11670 [Streptomyces thioluteus]|uniref:Uncharacterized protein n=1 Tax=Streptomyces thioluteus TaxID=66431 RepID=A0ABN3WIC7_STRTU